MEHKNTANILGNQEKASCLFFWHSIGGNGSLIFFNLISF